MTVTTRPPLRWMACACQRPISPAPTTAAWRDVRVGLTSDRCFAKGAHVHAGEASQLVAVQLDPASGRCGVISGCDHLEHVTTILARSGRQGPAREGLERTLEDVARGDHARLLRVASERLALVSRLLPRHPRDAVIDPQVRPGASMETSGDPRAPAERRAQRGVQGLGAHLEVLRLALAQTVLDDLGQTSSAELQGAER